MNVCILGWYGTETLGDRAILDGIINIFSSKYSSLRVSVASLFPFFTHRTFLEDGEIYRKSATGMKLSYFDVKNDKLLMSEIKKSDIVLMGGGPIMDLDELNIIAYSFKVAKKQKKKTMIFGCGLGPLIDQHYIDITEKIFSYSDVIIFRDKLSCDLARFLYGRTIKNDFLYDNDPAIVSIGKYLSSCSDVIEKYSVAVNFREYPNSFNANSHFSDRDCKELITGLAAQFDSVILVPMHTFSIGGDDRSFLTKISNNINLGNINVIHKPLNLYEVYNIYSSAHSCIGMRYHSVMFQTILNGNNYIIDYTQPGRGKICGFLQMVGGNNYYSDRYWNVHIDTQFSNSVWDICNLLKNKSSFEYDNKIFDNTLSYYSNFI